MATVTPPSPSWWAVPAWMKQLYDWRNVLLLLSLLVGAPASWFFGVERGAYIGVFLAVAYVLVWLASVGINRARAAIQQATDLLETSNVKKNDKDPAIANLKRSRAIIGGLLAVLILVVMVQTACLAWWSPAWAWWRTAPPEQIKFESLAYYLPDPESRLLEEAPFLEAVLASLREEGSAEGRKYRILLGATEPLAHPTPPFRCQMRVNDAQSGHAYEVAGYAFRRRKGAKPTLYEPIGIDFSHVNPVFTLPACDQGDTMFVVVRITPLSDSNFPADPNKISTLDIVK